MTTLPAPRSASRLPALAGLVAFAVAVAALTLFPSFVRKPYVLHMGVMLFLAVRQSAAVEYLR